MPERLDRLDRVTVALNRGPVILTWDVRQALMRRLQHVQSTARLRVAFEGVGASEPVELTESQTTALLLTLEGWTLDLDGYEPIPPELLELRTELIADLHHAERASPPSPRP